MFVTECMSLFFKEEQRLLWKSKGMSWKEQTGKNWHQGSPTIYLQGTDILGSDKFFFSISHKWWGLLIFSKVSVFFIFVFFSVAIPDYIIFFKASQFWNPVAGLIRWVGRLDAAHGPSVDSHWFTSSLQLAGMDTRYNVLLSLSCGTALMSPDTEGHLFHFKLLSAFTLIRGDVPHAAHMHIATGLFIGRIWNQWISLNTRQ